jgi:16S rRNA (cytidine1402-2'-O)-methyltransferase
MLYLIATPIGNLEDMTYRACRILSECDYILCEDTRKSQILLNHYSIQKKLISFHKFNEKQKEKMILEDLLNGKNIALISDAGSPIACDPGKNLVLECHKNKIPYTSIPGCSAIINSYVLAPLEKTSFQFLGFLEEKEMDKLKRFLFYPDISIAFVSPHKIEKILKKIHEISPDSFLVVTREMTKKFEEVLVGKAEELMNHFIKNPPLGEMTILTIGKEITPNLTIEEMMILLQKNFCFSEKEAFETIAKIKKIPKKTLYKKFKIDHE